MVRRGLLGDLGGAEEVGQVLLHGTDGQVGGGTDPGNTEGDEE